MTATDLEVLPEDGFRYELIRGELVQMSPAGREHGNIGHNFARQFGNFVEEHGLGEVYQAETGFQLTHNPDTVLAPDCAFICREGLAEIEGVKSYIPIPPDLAVEVIPPNDRYTAVNAKIQDWLNFGVRVVVVINPRKQQISVYRSETAAVVLNRNDRLELPDLVPGWSLALSTIFR